MDISSRLAPKSPVVRWGLRALVGNMHFRCILLPNEPVAEAEADEVEDEVPLRLVGHCEGEPEKPDLRLWGLTLGMTL